MAYNPFLSANEPSATITTDELNPFMITDAEPDAFTGDNPFATSNPFSDFGGGYEPPAGDTVPVDIFGGAEPTGVGAKHFEGFTEDTTAPLDIFTSGPADHDRIVKPTELDLISTTTDHTFLNEEESQEALIPARPLPPETQNLILSVTGQMEFTSSDLLDRIPLTRTPSPVSVRDIHSPSPTPEPEPMEDPPSDSFDINRNKPVRPPPARPPPAARPPPPRPQPPRPPSAPPVPPTLPVALPPEQATNDINLFDAPVPTPIKPTKEAIMSLYMAPKQEEKQIDFLSDDIVDDISTDVSHDPQSFVGEIAKPSSTVAGQACFELEEQSAVSVPDDSAFPSAINSMTDAMAPMDCSEPQTEIASATSNTSPFADVMRDDFPNQPVGLEVERNPFESAVEPVDAVTLLSDPAADIFGVKSDAAIMAVDNNIFNSGQSNIFQSASKSVAEESQVNLFSSAPIETFGDTSQPFGSENAFAATDPSPSMDAGWSVPPEAMMQDAFPSGQDAFDAFSAKFDATGANNLNSGKFFTKPLKLTKSYQ